MDLPKSQNSLLEPFYKHFFPPDPKEHKLFEGKNLNAQRSQNYEVTMDNSNHLK